MRGRGRGSCKSATPPSYTGCLLRKVDIRIYIYVYIYIYIYILPQGAARHTIGRSMHSISQRASTLSSMVTTAAFVVMVLVSIMTLAVPFGTVAPLHMKNVRPVVSLKNTRNYGASKNQAKENARFKFDLVADFSNTVDWNTKQIFTYVFVELDDVAGEDSGSSSSSSNSNKLVIWDKILTDKNNMYINYKNIKSKYSVWDYSPQLHGRSGHFKLGYNVQPHVGPLTFGEIDLNQTITFPDVKA